MTLSDLIAKVEAATGPDREIDLAIAEWRSGTAWVAAPIKARPDMVIKRDLSRFERWMGPYLSSLATVPLYTASLDAAIGLVERVLQGGMFAPFGPFWHVSARAYVDGVFHEEKARADIKHPLTDCSAARWTGIAATPALALLLALLRSLQHQGEQT